MAAALQTQAGRVIPCYRPSLHSSDLVAALIPTGGKKRFEAALAACTGARFAMSFGTGRQAFQTCLSALGLVDAEIILPAFTCPTMLEAVLASGNRPVFVDISLNDYGMEPAALERAASPRTRVVVVTHLYGYRADVARVREIFGDNGVLIFEDCAQRMVPASGSRLGFTGDVALFSGGRSKPICTIQGGVLVTNSETLQQQIHEASGDSRNRVSAHTWVRRWAWFLASYVVYRDSVYGAWQRTRSGRPAPAFPHDEPLGSPPPTPQRAEEGFASFQARIGCSQLGRLDAMIKHRQDIARVYDGALGSVPVIGMAPVLPEATYTFYTIRVPGRDKIGFDGKMKDNGVMIGRTFNTALPDLCPSGAPSADFPNARRAAREVVNLPIHPFVDADAAERIARAVRRSMG